MKPNTYKKVVIAVMASIALTGAASAQSIGVDFNNAGAANQSPSYGTDSPTSIGPAGISSTAWYNNVDLTNSPFLMPTINNTYNSTPSPLILNDTTNTSTGIQLGFTQYGYNSLDGTNPYSPGYGASGSANSTLTSNQQLFNGAAQSAGGGHTQELTLNNISYSSYSVYLLVEAVSGNAGYPNAGQASVEDYTNSMTATPVAGTTYYLASGSANVIPSSGFSWVQGTSTSSGSPTAGATYVLFSGLTSSSVSFDIDSPGIPNNNGAYFGGLEIIDTASTPEPSTYALMLAGLGFLVVTLRRRRLV